MSINTIGDLLGNYRAAAAMAKDEAQRKDFARMLQATAITT